MDLDQGPALSPYLQHVQGEEGEDLKRGHELPFLVHQPEAVGVAVQGETGVCVRLRHQLGQLREVVGHGLRLAHSREGGVALAVNLRDGGLAASQNGGEVARARSVHGVYHYLHPGSPSGRVRPAGGGGVHCRRRRGLCSAQRLLQGPRPQGRCGAALPAGTASINPSMASVISGDALPA